MYNTVYVLGLDFDSGTLLYCGNYHTFIGPEFS